MTSGLTRGLVTAGLVTALAMFAGVAPACAAPQGPVVTVEGGAVAGRATDDLRIFQGIPYAAPPVGDRRWRAPAPVLSWQGTRDATRFGAACMQPSGRKEAWAQVGPTSEDCLFLNIWQPAKPGKYPVMVFLHGGGFTYGSAGVPLYDGAALARRGVVVVTLNYRLGVLGFFAHPALTREAPGSALGNYGIMDQIAALRWVRKNIAAFQGDARNVTAFGESAGAGTVQLLMGAPAAEGLFDKAISQSGAGGSVLPSFAKVEAVGKTLSDAAGLGDVTAAQLRGLPADKLLLRSFPFIDGKVVVASPGTAFLRKREMKIPLIIGANSNESTLSSNNADGVKLALGTAVSDFETRYVAARPGKSADAAKTDLAEDVLSILPSVSIGAMHAAAGGRAYSYYFDQVPASQRAGSAGAGHGDELQYLFGNPYDGAVWDDADRAVSRAIGNYWVQFARTGDPNAKGTVAWPRIDEATAPHSLTIATPIRATMLTPLEEQARKAALATSIAAWTNEP